MEELTQKHCKPCEGGVPPFSREAAQTLLDQTRGWAIDNEGKQINRTFRFKNFYETMAFVNAVAWIANQEDHHPDLEVGYSRCLVKYSTHAIGGLSENDFICAAKINALLPDQEE